jgi:hypothetical protein
MGVPITSRATTPNESNSAKTIAAANTHVFFGFIAIMPSFHRIDRS